MENLSPYKEPTEYRDKVLSMMKGYELLIARLYALYAEKLPEMKDFWLKLVEEEKTHAYWIETLGNQLNNKNIFFNEDRFKIQPIQGCIDDVNERITRTETGSVESIMALAESHDIEAGMIEHKFFEIYETDSVEIKHTLKMLEEATNEHQRRVDAMLAEKRSAVQQTDSGFFSKLKKLFQ